MTNREMYEQIKTHLTDAEEIAFVDSCIASIDRKAEKAKERAAAKKIEGDALRETILSVLTNEPQVLSTIVAKVQEITGDETFSSAKAIPRLTALCQLNQATKEKVKTDNGDKMGYYLYSSIAE